MRMLEQKEPLCVWEYNQTHNCYCKEKIVYTQKATAPQLQVLSIYVPEAYINEDGSLREGKYGEYTTQTAPVVFENNAAGYSEMPDVHPGEERWCGTPYLEQGMIYVTCGCRGRQTRGGKGVAQLVDFKTAIRFLRHHRECLPGDWNKLISVGFSAGGAMSALISCTGNNVHYEELLRENGAYMEESDAVYAAQIYCPITDLEHADMAYEWCFQNSMIAVFPRDNESGELTPFRQALSKKFAIAYIRYFNDMQLKHPETGELLLLGEDGRSGSGYAYLVENIQVAYERFINAQMMSTEVKCDWSDLESYVTNHRPRLKNCPAFDWLEADSCENQLFGSDKVDCRHFNEQTAVFIEELKDEFPEEYEKYYASYKQCFGDEEQQQQKFLLNPLSFIGTGEKCDIARHFRICVGSQDADTSLTVSMSLALKLAECTDSSVEYRIIWNQPHCEADEPGEVQRWIQSII